jgi:hypothetical protein
MGENRASLAFAQPPAEYASFTDESVDIQPPPIPADRVPVFGEPPIPSIPPLSEQNCPTLYDENAPPLFELKKINHRILFTFQKLVGIIATGTESPDECLDQIRFLFLNAHYLLHKLRAVQSYETMHHYLREQNRKLEEFKQEFDAKLREIATLRPP